MLPDEEPLPVMDNGMSFDQLQAMNGVNMTEEDMMAAGMVPDAVANDVAAAQPEVRRAEPNIQPTGAFMDLGFINQINAAATDEEATAMYNSLDPVQKRVYDRSFGINISPEWAAGEASKYYEEQDRARMAKESPQAKALDIAQAEKAQKTVEMSNDILSIMDRLRGFKKGEKDSEKKTPKYFGRVGAFDSLLPAATSGDRAGWYIDHKTLEDTLALAEAQANRGQGNFTETERLMLRSAATGGLNYGRDDASYAQIFEGMYDMFKNKAEQQKSIAGPGKGAPAAAAPQTKKVGNQTWVRTPDGWLPQR
jgi:hypothetical protein